MMKKQLTLFFAALQFYTRIPIPAYIQHDPDNLNPATRFLPLVGWIVGGGAALVWMLIALVDVQVAIICSMIASVLITGALHEDGFADFCDGFGGGWTKEKILLIMKDSRIGAYGVIGLIGMLALKFSLLNALSNSTNAAIIGFCMITAHALSRFMCVIIVYYFSYARETEDSKAAFVAKRMLVSTFAVAGLFGVMPLFFLAFTLKSAAVFMVIPALAVVTLLMGGYFKKWIGGYTGDCLGAVQQVCEVLFYFFLLIVWRFI
ncbi:Adenosylcobinamide-GDP ribazoletransferase [Dyadobacter sp. CECT 9623]|uniref:Adenosylcobinamide-GDP ribazoletransferase n=1 Tax=Dyadobacter linearis TaxID=2823330 RepID=A0ABM8UVR8_9BACT|nr:adenosylcobinamide-GDP ribazoletransferase [Dyadobacter sp. CECT 9623]CAG5072816.1 Adenosylcobinamide-GDP ribazoletransferase [Dyadobacter sp. CECT 9623]